MGVCIQGEMNGLNGVRCRGADYFPAPHAFRTLVL